MGQELSLGHGTDHLVNNSRSFQQNVIGQRQGETSTRTRTEYSSKKVASIVLSSGCGGYCGSQYTILDFKLWTLRQDLLNSCSGMLWGRGWDLQKTCSFALWALGFDFWAVDSLPEIMSDFQKARTSRQMRRQVSTMVKYVDAAEVDRLKDDTERRKNWKRWGPYVSERQWGTVREDYSVDGNWWDQLSPLAQYSKQ